MDTVQETWVMFCEKQLLQTNSGQKKKWNQFSLRPTLDLLDQEYPGLKENFFMSPVGKGGSVIVEQGPCPWMAEVLRLAGTSGGQRAQPCSLRAAVKHNQQLRPIHIKDNPPCYPSTSPDHGTDFGNAMGSIQMFPKKIRGWEVS